MAKRGPSVTFSLIIATGHSLSLHPYGTTVEANRGLQKDITSFSATDDKQVEEFRIKYLGTKGIVKAIMSEMKM